MYEEDEEKITLDRSTFKTLASDTRVGILKSLNVRRKTLSELSVQYGMSVSTIKEHLDNLAGAGLIKQIDDGHKWKYYELTRKGRGVLNPEQKKIWVLLSIAAAAILLTGADMFTGFLSAGRQFMATGLLEDALSKTVPVTGGGEAVTGAVTTGMAIPWVHIALIAMFAGLFTFSAIRMVRNRNVIRF